MAHPKTKLVVKDHGFDSVMQRLKDLAAVKTRKVKVGVLADSEKGGLHQKGKDGKAAKLTVAEIFAVLNYGTKDGRIPPAPVLQTVFDEQREELKEEGALLLGEVVFGMMTLDHALGILGAKLVSAVKHAIVSGFPPPNRPSTALAKVMKGKTKSLFRRRGLRAATSLGQAFAMAGALAAVKRFIDTGQLLNSITWAIDQGGEGGHEGH